MPGAKQVHRAAPIDGREVIALRDEVLPDGAEPLLVQVMRHGHRIGAPDAIEQARARFERDLTTIPHPALDLRTPHVPTVRYSEALLALADEITHRLQQPTHPVPSRR